MPPGNAASADNGFAAYPFPLEKSPRLSGDVRRNTRDERDRRETRDRASWSGLWGIGRDERDWRDADLVVLVYLVEEKQGDLESAFCGLACWLSPMSRG
jgi:hypothetical protein